MNGQKQKFSELKKQAREAMAGRCGTLVGATAINLFLTFSCSLIPTLIFSGTTLYDIIFLNLTLFLFSLLLSLFQAGYLKICLSTLRGEPISVGDMLYAFYHHPDQYVLMFLIINGISSVIALISSIPGFQYLSSPSAELTLGTALSIDAELSSLMNVYVYKLIGSLVSTLVLVPFSLSTFVMNDAPGIGPIQAIRQSFVLMKKNFFRYILLLLSFLGLEILASCSCAIGFLWVMPYMQITMAAFYQERKRLFSYVYFKILNSRADSALDSVEFLCFFSVLLLCDFACDECELLGQTWNCYDFYFSEQLLDLTLALCGVAGYADEEAALHIIDLQQVQFLLAPAHHDVSAFVLCAVYNIGNNGTCGREFSCSASVEHGISKNISMHKYCVKHIIYAVKRALLAHQERSYHCIESISNPAACCKKFDGHAKLFGIFHICRCDLCNSFCINILVIQEFSICQRGKNGNLTACVLSFHISGRISLCVAFFLSLFQNSIEISAFCDHLIQHIVSSSVQNSADLIDLICGKRTVDGTNDRDSTATACLEKEVDLFLFCNFHKLRTVLGNQSFI